jgi:tungstate transport system substrate-binding protein
LTVNGLPYTAEGLKDVSQVTVETTDAQGASVSYTGIPILKVLEKAYAAGTTLLLTASDGTEASMPLADLTDQAILVTQDDGKLKSVIPGQPAELSVANLTKLRVTLEVSPAAEGATLFRLATSGDTADTGILDYLLPAFEAANNVHFQIVAATTGRALALSQTGDVDVLLTHDLAAESMATANGVARNRQDIMKADYVIVGPAADPAGIKGMTAVGEAFTKVAEAKAPFCSRSDGSDTFAVEKVLWKQTDVSPEGDWYLALGQNMAETLATASEKGAYTVVDRATWLSNMDKLQLVVMVEGDILLKNPYSVMTANVAMWPKTQTDLAAKFTEWLMSIETQQRIADYKNAAGESLFLPNSEPWQNAHK